MGGTMEQGDAPLRRRLATNPDALTRVLGIVYGTLSSYVLEKARLTRATGAVTQDVGRARGLRRERWAVPPWPGERRRGGLRRFAYFTLKRGNKRSALPRSIICSNARESFSAGSGPTVDSMGSGE
jgi:hypothetical protein